MTIREWVDQREDKLRGMDVAERLKRRYRHLVTLEPGEIAKAEAFARTKAPTWVKFPNPNLDPDTDDAGGYRRDEYALWLLVKSNTEFGKPSNRGGVAIGWFKILYSVVTDPGRDKNMRVRWLQYAKDDFTDTFYRGLFFSPVNTVHDTIRGSCYRWPGIKQQIARMIKEKLERGEVFHPIYGRAAGR
jgi:hypothetical protein